jgi:hypothetical protein
MGSGGIAPRFFTSLLEGCCGLLTRRLGGGGADCAEEPQPEIEPRPSSSTGNRTSTDNWNLIGIRKLFNIWPKLFSVGEPTLITGTEQNVFIFIK